VLRIDDRNHGSKKVEASTSTKSQTSLAITDLDDTDQLYRRLTINEVPDDVLLEIFNIYMNIYLYEDRWHTLVHVCRRWRWVVFASPCRLNLQLLCTNRRPVQNALDVWPQLPIVIRGKHGMSRPQDTKNLIAALKQRNRVCMIEIKHITKPWLRRIGAIKEPFPELTGLELSSRDKMAAVLPDSFLDRSTPRLQDLTLSGIPFPGLSKLLLSTHDLVTLHLWDIPPSGYISPEAMVTTLSSLTRLKEFKLGLRSPRSRADRESRSPPPLIRVVLPALTEFYFKGDSEYLEDTVSRINAPLVDSITISFFNQLTFDTPLLRHFLCRTEIFKVPHRATVDFYYPFIKLTVFSRGIKRDRTLLELGISCKPSDWQLSSLVQVCSSSLPPLPTLERLEIRRWNEPWQDDLENSQWLELLHLIVFSSVKDLVLDDQPAQLVAPALQELTGEKVTEVLPALQNLFLTLSARSGPIQDAIAQFVTARWLSGHPVAVFYED
jgi:hypothetical protein